MMVASREIRGNALRMRTNADVEKMERGGSARGEAGEKGKNSELCRYIYVVVLLCVLCA